MKIKELPQKLKELALQQQVAQGNEPNEELDVYALVEDGGFDWDNTPQGGWFWGLVTRGMFDEANEVSIWKENGHKGILVRDLEDNIRVEAMKEQCRQGLDVTTLVDLFEAFDWSKSKLGYDFWEYVYHNQCEPEQSNKVDNDSFASIVKGVADLLEYKNAKYGNSALNPINVFNGKSKVGQRADDKISRIQNSDVLKKNDIVDLMGYLILICKENNWTTFDEFKD